MTTCSKESFRLWDRCRDVVESCSEVEWPLGISNGFFEKKHSNRKKVASCSKPLCSSLGNLQLLEQFLWIQNLLNEIFSEFKALWWASKLWADIPRIQKLFLWKQRIPPISLQLMSNQELFEPKLSSSNSDSHLESPKRCNQSTRPRNPSTFKWHHLLH